VTSAVSLRAAAKYVDDDILDEDWTNFGVGASYNFSSRTEAFVNVWVDDRARETLVEAVPEVRRSNNGANSFSEDSTHFGFGVRHSF